MNRGLWQIAGWVIPAVVSAVTWWAGKHVVQKYPPREVFQRVNERVKRARRRRASRSQ